MKSIFQNDFDGSKVPAFVKKTEGFYIFLYIFFNIVLPSIVLQYIYNKEVLTVKYPSYNDISPTLLNKRLSLL